MSKPARAGVNQKCDLALEHSERSCPFGVEDSFNALDFKKVIAGAQSAELILAPLPRPLRDRLT
jgi:hypothetical protein